MHLAARSTQWRSQSGRTGSERGDLVAAMMRRYKLFLLCFLAALAGTGAALWWLPASYTARAVMRVDVDEIDTADPQSALSSTRELELRRDHQIETQLQLLNSRPLMRTVVHNLALYDDPEFNPAYGLTPKVAGPVHVAGRGRSIISPLMIEAVTDRLDQAVKIAQDGTTEFINIDVTSASPEKAARIANKLASTFIETQVTEKKAANGRAIAALQRQVADLHDQLVTGERSAADYKRQHRLDGSDLAGSAALRVSQVAGELAAAQAGRTEAQAKATQGAASISSPLLDSLRAQESSARQRLADLLTSFGARHPDVQKARAQLAEIERAIAVETARARGALTAEVGASRARESQLTAQLNALQSRSLDDLITAVPLADMDRSGDATRAIYVALLGRLDTLIRENDLVRPDATLAFTALPPISPSSPKAARIFVASTAGALLTAILLVVILEQADKTIRTARHVWSIARLPTLGMVPQLGRARREQLTSANAIDRPYSAFSEEMRAIVAKLIHLLPGEGPGVILITSPEPRDGKTTLSLALAAAAVAVDREVTLLDLDLRRPTMASLLQLDPERPDLLSYLSGEATLEQSIQRCPMVPLLNVLASFRAAGDPVALLMNPSIAALLERLREIGQIVIVNTPPVLAVADAAMLTKHADLSVLVLHWGRTTEETLRRAMAELDNEISGVVLNHVAPAYAPRASYENYAYHRGSGRLRQFLVTRRRADRALARATTSRADKPALRQ